MLLLCSYVIFPLYKVFSVSIVLTITASSTPPPQSAVGLELMLVCASHSCDQSTSENVSQRDDMWGYNHATGT